jgi:hypothetical protein
MPKALLISISAIGKGYSSLGVVLCKLRKSTHTRILPVFFISTGTMLETYIAYRQV